MRLILWSIVAVVSLCLSACAGTSPGKVVWQDPEHDLVWPAPPDPARIQYLRSLHGPGDLRGKTKSSNFITWFFGEEEEEPSLLNPYAVAADGLGRVWVTDMGTHLLHVFDLSRNKVDYVQEINGQTLEFPAGIVFDPLQQRLFVSDASKRSIFVLNNKGEFLAEWQPPGGFSRPAGMAVDAAGLLYVADALDGHILVFDQEGRLLRKIGSKTTGDGRFVRPVNVAIGPEGEVLVVDAMNFHVEVQSPEGDLISVLGSVGDSAGFFARPKGVAVGQDGHAYVTDSAFDNVQVFDMAGNLLMFFGSAGNSAGSFNLPAGIFMDSVGRLYVVDPYNQRVQIFQTIQHD